MKAIIISLFILTLSYISVSAQNAFVPSAKKYVKIVDYTDDSQTDLSKYKGQYLYIYPGYDKNSSAEGDAYMVILELNLSKDGKNVYAVQTIQIPEKESIKTSDLSNPSVFGNTFNSDELTGKFVVIKYKKNDSFSFAKGILRKHLNDTDYDFYEKTK